MSKFFNEKNPLAGFEEFLATQKISKISDTQEIKKYDQGKIYTFL